LSALWHISAKNIVKTRYYYVYKNANISITKVLTGCLMAYQHIEATSDSEKCDNNYTRCWVGGAGVLLVAFDDRWA